MDLALLGRRACLVLVLSLIPAAVLAQGTSTATIAGVVRDPSGAVLPGVTVEAASPALIEKVRVTVTDERGEYRLPELRPGVYTVTFSLPGFATVRNEGIELRTNFTAQLEAELKVSQLEETITVTGSTPLVDTQSATQQRTISREVLDTVRCCVALVTSTSGVAPVTVMVSSSWLTFSSASTVAVKLVRSSRASRFTVAKPASANVTV